MAKEKETIWATVKVKNAVQLQTWAMDTNRTLGGMLDWLIEAAKAKGVIETLDKVPMAQAPDGNE